jgi:1-acyl-sn-glycerol-3-phosphate acyltransferase
MIPRTGARITFGQWFCWLLSLPTRQFIRHVYGREHLPSGPCVLACSHGSYIDGLLVAHAVWPRAVRPLVDAEWYDKRDVHWFLRMARGIVVPVRPPRRQVVKTAVKGALAGETVIIFPEGGVSGRNLLVTPKTGAARIALFAGVPLVPVKIVASHHVMPPSRWPRFRRTDIIIGRPLDLTGYKKNSYKDWRALTDELSRTINAMGHTH